VRLPPEKQNPCHAENQHVSLISVGAHFEEMPAGLRAIVCAGVPWHIATTIKTLNLSCVQVAKFGPRRPVA